MGVALSLCAVAQDNAGVPYALSFVEDTSGRFDALPAMHSFAFGEHGGHWVFVSGRTNGFHGFTPPGSNFSRGSANQHIVVFQPLGKPGQNVWTMAIANLSIATLAKDHLLSANTNTTQDGEDLVVVGGYGQSSAGPRQTYPAVSRIHLPTVIAAVKSNDTSLASSAIKTSHDERMRVTGGELRKLDDGFFYLVFGHDFNGVYLMPNETQTYTNEVRRFRLAEGPGGAPTVVDYSVWTHPEEFHRRDLNVEHVLLPNGALALSAYGGVFTPPTLPNGDVNPNGDMPYFKPILISSGGATIETGYEQKMSQYTCANIRLWDRRDSTMYTAFLGGLSRYTYNRTTRQFELAPKQGTPGQPGFLDGVPWIDTVTSLLRNSNGSYREHAHHEAPLPGYIGSNGKFVLHPSVRKAGPSGVKHDIIDLRAIRRPTQIGWLVGGIQSPVEQNANDSSVAMKQVYRVYLWPLGVPYW